MESLLTITWYLEQYRRLERNKALAENIFLLLAGLFLFGLLCFVLGALSLLFTGSVFALRLVFWLLAAGLAVKSCLDAWRWKKAEHRRLALILDQRLPAGRNHIINAWQLSELPPDAHRWPEPFLERLRNDTAAFLRRVNLAELPDKQRLRLYRKTALGSGIMLGLLLLLFPGSFRQAFQNVVLEPPSRPGPNSNPTECSIEKMKVTWRFPGYTGLKSVSEEKPLAEISGLCGTRVTAEFYFTNPAGDSEIFFGNNTTLADKGVSRRKEFSFILQEPTLYEIRYYDPIRKTYRVSRREKINVLYDRMPTVEITEPGRDVTAGPGSEIKLAVRAGDDFGLVALRIRVHTGAGEISGRDPIVYQSGLHNRREVNAETRIRTPRNFAEPIACYAEVTDNLPGTPNTGRSSAFFIYPATRGATAKNSATEQAPLSREAQEKLADWHKTLDRFIAEEKNIIAAAKKLAATQNYSRPDDLNNLQKLAASEEKWAETFQKMVNDLDKMGGQTKGKFTLAEESVEMVSHVRSAGRNLKKQNITISVTEAQTGLELAKEITTNIEKWLSEYPDYIKWDMQEPSKQYDVPEAELPDELEDMIGDLIDREEAMQDDVEDVTSSWMDSLDKGAGWGTSDGPMSNMSAKGVTGNLLPNQTEIGGRSGEGRTGRSYGEMVEKTASGKGGRKTPARLTPDNLEPGQVQDTSREMPLGPTGGGKVSGWGAEGLRGPAQDLSFKYDQMAGQQSKLIEQTEKLIREMKVLNVNNPQLEQTLAAMKQFQFQAKAGKYTNLMNTQQVIVSRLREAQQVLTRQSIMRIENSGSRAGKTSPGLNVWDEKIPPGYEKIVRQYYQKLAEH